MSLFAFILVLGIVVDDAIVVSENIYRLRRAGVPAQEAAVQGAQEVLIPVWLAVATNILAFTPLLFLPGPMGDFTKAIPIVAILCFSFSILESFVALPAHLSNLSDKPPPRGILGWIPRGQDAVARGLDWFVARLYTPALGAAVRHRYVSLAIGISGLLLTAGLVASGRVKFDFFPPIDADNVVCAISFPVGTPMETTAQALERLEESLDQTREEIEKEAGKPVFRHVMTTVGYHPLKRAQDPNWGANSASFSGSHLGEVNVELIPSEERQLSAGDVARRWRERVGTIAGLQEINFLVSATRGGKPIHIELRSNDLEALPRMAERVKAKLGEYPGVYDASHTYRAGQREVRVSLTPSGRALGLTTADLARQVRQAFHGEEAQRIQRGRDDVRVMVRYPVDERRSLGNLDRMRVRGPGGIEASFGDVAELVHASGPATIDRRDRMRTVTITAELDRTRANANEILADLQKGLLAELSAESPGLAFSFEGEQRDQREMMPNLFKGMVLVNLMIFAILAVTFRSYVQPGLVMLAIPFGVAGAILAHFFLGMNLTVLSTIGIMALMGVVVNDSIVMIEFVNEARAKGMPLFDAILHAGPIRFRPIMLTSLTTFAGLAPLLLEKSLQAQFLIPMVVSLAYGVVLSTAVVLFIVPAAYGILEDVRSGVRRLWQGKKESRIENQESHQAPGITDHSQS